MRSAALLALVAWRLVLVVATPTRQPLTFGADREPLSNIELLIPLLVSEQGESYQRAQEAPRPDDDMPFSRIPADAFTPDDDIRVPPRPRSLYLQADGADGAYGADSGQRQRSPPRRREQLARACERLGRAAGDALLYLCRELLDLADAARARPSPGPPAAPACPCCGADAALPGLRRDLMPLGEDPYMVERYINTQRKRPPPPWLTDP